MYTIYYTVVIVVKVPAMLSAVGKRFIWWIALSPL